MIVVDANYFLRAILSPATPQDVEMATQATTLFASNLVFTTTDAIVAEVVYVLQGRYGLDRLEIASRLRPLLSLAACKLPTKAVVLGALEIWPQRRRLSLVDAIALVLARDGGYSLATFDRNLATDAGVPTWSPTSQNGSQ